MRARATLRPGQPGTKQLVKQYGDRLICVRYRYDYAGRKRYKTAEIIVDETPWQPRPPAPDTVVYIRVDWDEVRVQGYVKAAGGKWHARVKLWALPYREVERLGLQERLAEPPVM